MEKKANLSFVFILFIIVYSVSSSSWELPYSNILRWVVIGLLLLAGILVNKKFYLSFPFFWLICAFTLGLIVSIGRDNFMVGLERMVSFFLLIIAMYTYFTIGENDSAFISKAICSFAVILEVLAVLLTGYFFVSGGTFGKYMAIYGNQNYLAPIACTMSTMSLLMFFRAKEGYLKMIHVICFICSTFLVLATGSRGGLLCFLAIIVLFPLLVLPELNFNSFLKQIIIIAVVIAVVYFLLRVIDIPALDRILGGNSSNSSTGLSRGEVWTNGIKLFLVKPVFGWGSSATYQYVFVNNTSGYSGWGIHSSYIMILIDHGVVGTILYSIFFVTYINRLVRKYKGIKENLTLNDKRILIALVSISLSLLIDAIAEAFLFAVGNFSSVCFWVSFIFIDIFLNSKFKLKESE